MKVAPRANAMNRRISPPPRQVDDRSGHAGAEVGGLDGDDVRVGNVFGARHEPRLAAAEDEHGIAPSTATPGPVENLAARRRARFAQDQGIAGKIRIVMAAMPGGKGDDGCRSGIE